MFIRPCYRNKDGKRHAYWALVESYRTQRGPRQRVVAYPNFDSYVTKSQFSKVFRLVFCRKSFCDGARLLGQSPRGDVVKTFHLGSV